jgi:hypothetical protein
VRRRRKTAAATRRSPVQRKVNMFQENRQERRPSWWILESPQPKLLVNSNQSHRVPLSLCTSTGTQVLTWTLVRSWSIHINVIILLLLLLLFCSCYNFCFVFISPLILLSFAHIRVFLGSKQLSILLFVSLFYLPLRVCYSNFGASNYRVTFSTHHIPCKGLITSCFVFFSSF